MSHALLSPFQLRSVTFPNRIGVSPMCQYSSQDGFASDWHLVHLGSRAQGGAGLVILEASAVVPEGRISSGDLGIWKDEHIPGLERIARFIHSQGTVAGIQLAHAGRKGSMSVPFGGERLLPPDEGGWQPVAPSALAFSPLYAVPAALDQAGIDAVIEAFRQAARRVLKAGFDVVEIHATSAPTLTAAALRTAAGSCFRWWIPSAPCGRRTCPCLFASPPPTGLRAAGRQRNPFC
jgi:2,4-dienoyl-CoA reductase-like NADH-dependent reductase (Old Yellow Enzyme family)